MYFSPKNSEVKKQLYDLFKQYHFHTFKFSMQSLNLGHVAMKIMAIFVWKYHKSLAKVSV